MTQVLRSANLHHQAAQLGAYVLCSNVSRLEVGHGLSRAMAFFQGRYLVGQLGGGWN